MQRTRTLAWKFLEPWEGKSCQVLLAGPHFSGGFEYLKREVDLENDRSSRNSHRPVMGKIELVTAPTRSLMKMHASHVHVAIPFMEPLQSNFIDAAPRLRLIQQYGVGLEGVDMVKATDSGIAVCNIPAEVSGNAQATAEHAIYLTTSLLRHSKDWDRRFLNRQLGGLPMPRTLYQKRVTVVGYGSVGKILVKYLITMGSIVTVVRKQKWNTAKPDNDLDGMIRKVDSLNDALPTTDVLILACTLTKETRHLINEPTVARFVPGVLLVNVGRGPLVQYEAIVNGLQSGQVGGFASDVGLGHPTLPSEPWDPQCNRQLTNHPSVIFTPHVAGYTDYSYEKMAQHIVKTVLGVMQGKQPPYWVNQKRPFNVQYLSF
jgi:phosphoglycerate dehydrogenase-like enzyme